MWFLGEGQITYRYLLEQIAEVNAHPQFEPDFDTFVDFGPAEVSHQDGGMDDYETFFARHQEGAAPRRWAIYTTRPETLENANMVHFMAAREIQVDVFVHRQSALGWLGRPDPAIR